MERLLHPAGSPQGHTLLELVVVVALLVVTLFLPALSVFRALDLVSARGAAQTWQGAAALAQTAALWRGTPTKVVAAPSTVEETDGRSTNQFPLGARIPLTCNVSRWSRPSGLTVTFDAGFAAPDSAGSLTFGEAAWASRVVVRMETGLTHRARP
jgi:Tfp pilus assembly protein FimT